MHHLYYMDCVLNVYSKCLNSVKICCVFLSIFFCCNSLAAPIEAGSEAIYILLGTGEQPLA